MARKCFLPFMVLVFFLSCTFRTKQERFLDFINNPSNRISQIKNVSGIAMTAQYLPAEFNSIIQKERSHSDTPDDDYQYFQFNIKYPATRTLDKSKVDYSNFDIAEDFMLVSGNDSAKAVFCQKIPDGIGNSLHYMMAFDKPKNLDKEDLKLVYADKIFGTGDILFLYLNKDLAQIPKIN